MSRQVIRLNQPEEVWTRQENSPVRLPPPTAPLHVPTQAPFQRHTTPTGGGYVGHLGRGAVGGESLTRLFSCLVHSSSGWFNLITYLDIPLFDRGSESEVKWKFVCLRFRWNFAHLKIKTNKFLQFSSFLILLKKWGKKSDSSLKIGKNFTKDFPVKKISQGISL